MESNSDKAMRDKLQGVEMPFDPAAWEQMEAMLDKKEKKRGFFWLWFGTGMAALLLLTVAGTYMVTNSETVGKAPLAEARTSVSNTKGSVATNGKGNAVGSSQVNKAGSEHGKAIGSTQVNKAGNEELPLTNEAGSLHGNSSRSDNAGKAPNTNKGSVTKNQGISASAGAATGVNTTKKQRSKGSAKSSAALTSNQQLATSNQGASTRNRRTSARNQQPTSGNPLLLTDFNGKSVSATGAEVINANKYWLTYLNPAEEEYSPAKNERSDKLPEKMRSKVFQYSMGALVNVSGSMVKNGIGDTSKRVTMGPTPSFMIGFTHDFMFARRFAISNSILYSQTSFTVKRPRTLSFTQAPVDFTCRISEVAIPIGIKVYPVVSPKFRFYLSAGVINHIKLSETFSYTTKPAADTTIPNLAADVKNIYPTQTIFDGAGNGAVETTDANLNAGTTTTTISVNTTEFSINNAKRYYASFYAGAGVEGIIKNRWMLFAEPSFNMSLQKIGIQERRKYNVGANLGFRYQF